MNKTDAVRERERLTSRLRELNDFIADPNPDRRLPGGWVDSSSAPKVMGKCAGCGRDTLFLGNGGYVTCSYFECDDPTASHEVLMSGTSFEVTDKGIVLRQWTGETRFPPQPVTTAEGPVGEVGKPPHHYAGAGGLQPFQIIDAFGLDFFEGSALKYLLRWRKKNGVEDLRKAIHYITEVIERAN